MARATFKGIQKDAEAKGYVLTKHDKKKGVYYIRPSTQDGDPTEITYKDTITNLKEVLLSDITEFVNTYNTDAVKKSKKKSQVEKNMELLTKKSKKSASVRIGKVTPVKRAISTKTEVYEVKVKGGDLWTVTREGDHNKLTKDNVGDYISALGVSSIKKVS